MKKETYIKMTQPFRNHPELAKGLHIMNKICTTVMYLAYPVLLVYLLFYTQITGRISSYYSVRKAFFVPAVSFVILTLVRAWINRPRPYETFEIPPVIKKDTRGNSFPSRHVFSAGIIAMTFLLMSPWWWIGLLFLGVSIVLAVVRVVSGVHYISDVVAGFCAAVVAAVIGYLIL